MPRAGLSPELVVTEAARLADEHGYERLSLAAVADRFGVAVPSLYKHVDGVDDLRRRVAVLAVEELGGRLASAASGGLAAVAHAYRDYARAHPGRYAATIRAADPSDTEGRGAAEEVLTIVLDVLSGYGISGDEAVDAARALRSSLHGFVSLETAGGFGIPRDVERSFRRLVDILERVFSEWGGSAPG